METPIPAPNPVTGPILLPVPREARRELAGRQAVSAATIAAELRSRLHDADFATRQAILRLVVERVIVNQKGLEIHLALPVSGVCHLSKGWGAEPRVFELGLFG